MRKQLLAIVFLPLVLLAVGDTQNPGPTAPAALQKVDVIRDADSTRVEITGSGQWTPKVTTLTSPFRVLVTLPDTSISTANRHIDVDGDPVKAVRIGSDGK